MDDMDGMGVDPEITHDLQFAGVDPHVDEGGDPVPGRRMSPGERLAFQVLSGTTAPVWFAMILFPRSRFTAWLVKVTTPTYAILGIAYVGLLGKAMFGEEGNAPDFTDPDSLRGAFASPTAFLAGWTHYLVFDLFVGRHIWQTSLDEERTDRLSLLLTWMAGPLGLTLHLARSSRHRRRTTRQ